jgi:hypothetical protein
LDTGGRATELFEAAPISLPHELVEFELSNNDNRDWPRRIVAEWRTFFCLSDGVWQPGRIDCLSSVMIGFDDVE